ACLAATNIHCLSAANEPQPLKAEFIEVQPKHFQATVDLGDIPIGWSGKVKVEILNTSKTYTIVLDDGLASCGCVSISVDRKQIPPGESVLVDLELKVSSKERKADWSQFVSFGNSGKSSIARIRFDGNVKGVLSTSTDRLLLFVDDDSPRATGEFRITTSLPVEIKNIELRGDSSIDIFNLDLQETPSGDGVLTVSVNAGDVPADGVMSGLVLVDSVTGRQCNLICMAMRRGAISVSPAVIRISQKEGRWNGKAVILRRRDDNPEKKTSAVVRGSIGKIPLAVDVKQASNRFARAAFSIDKDKLDQAIGDIEAPEIEWEILWGTQRMILSTPVVLRHEQLIDVDSGM
ncbi:MAG: DUF1573 domain-containing protein, partial [Pirellulales bacterium]|nr:DUF1573 domain-containing protein [Pirellulales bacterium]